MRLMKMKYLWPLLAGTGLLLVTNGCGKSETTPPAPPASQTTPTNTTPSTSAIDAQKAADTQKAAEALKAAEAKKLAEAEALKKAEEEKAAQALKKAEAEKQAQLAAATAKVASLIESAKKLSGENKYAEAMKILNDLASQNLSANQQSLVDTLKAEIKKQIEAAAVKKATDEAGKAIGGLLTPKK
jgi:hypothetical protein